MTSSTTDESACRFVSSRGLLKSCDIHSSAPISSSPTDLHHVNEFIMSPRNKEYDSTSASASASASDDFDDGSQGIRRARSSYRQQPSMRTMSTDDEFVVIQEYDNV